MKPKQFKSESDLLRWIIDILDTYSYYFDCNEEDVIEAQSYLEELAQSKEKE